MRILFDIETDNLLRDVTEMHLMWIIDIDTGDKQYFLEDDLRWKSIFEKATLVIGHNIIGYDLMVLRKLFNVRLPRDCSIHDTLVMSQVLDYKRFGNAGHSLDVWGQALGFPKIDFHDWTQFSQEMLEYGERDVDLNLMIYDVLVDELTVLMQKAPQIVLYLKAEHAVSMWCAVASLEGWPFDLDYALEMVKRLEAEKDKAYAALSFRLGIKCVAKDKKLGKVEWKEPKWTKQGCYNSHTANWFEIDPYSGFEGEERMILGPYSRVEFKELSLDSITDVKLFLFRNGWVPTEYNYKTDPITFKKIQMSPKITEDSLEFLGGDGKLYVDFLTASSRLAVLKGWIENTDSNGRLHGDCMTIGTPSMRARHSIIVNVPSADSKWGKEMRSLFSCLPGWKLVGCDSAGNQARGLAHYLGDQTFIDTLLHGDIHQFNADTLTGVLADMGINHVVPRSVAKRILYAFLFGASGSKLWSYIFGYFDDKKGKKLKEGFVKAVPGFKMLTEKLEKIYGSTSKNGEGYIPSIAGNRIYVDSFHKLLVYLLQSCEKITCSAAVMLAMENLEKENIPYIPLIFMHDEIDFMVPEEHAERAREIGVNAFREGPKLFGVNIMDGDGKIGDSWYDIH
jgi:DNA polymerase-1